MSKKYIFAQTNLTHFSGQYPLSFWKSKTLAFAVKSVQTVRVRDCSGYERRFEGLEFSVWWLEFWT